MRIILASASPRRRELLAQIGLEFEIKVSNVEEVVTATRPAEVVEELSLQKAQAVYTELLNDGKCVADVSCDGMTVSESRAGSSYMVIGADTVVAIGDSILGKPKDEEDAKKMLRALSGKTHAVYTGVSVITAAGVKTFHEKTNVTFFPMSEEEIAEYVATLDCMDKAGAYGIQGFCARYIAGIDGDYNNVVGLPVGRLYQEIKEWV